MAEGQYATPRFAKGSTGLRFTDKGTGGFYRWNGEGYAVVSVVPPSSWENPRVPEYFIARSCSVTAEGHGEDILATENELEMS